jgi:hypothetical protein
MEKTLLEFADKTMFESQENEISRKRGRKPDDDTFIDNCEKYKSFVLENKRKPQSKQNQIITNRLIIDEKECQLSNWYYSTNRNKNLSSIRRMKFDEIKDDV